MSLDLTKVAAQVSAMVAFLKGADLTRRRCIASAAEALRGKGADLEFLKAKAAASRTTWMVAAPLQKPDSRFSAPPAPADFTALATDGSHIDVDRHRSTRCFLTNISSVVLRYGAQPDATLRSEPHLCSDEKDLVIAAPNGSRGREQTIEGVLLGVKRAVEECRQLAVLAAEQPPATVNLGLLDGSLILWNLETARYPDFVLDLLLYRGFLADLDKMRQLNADRSLGVAGYISFPRATDVVGLMRLALCPREAVDSDTACPICKSRECERVEGVRDRDLFAEVLAEGERSALFISPSQVQRHYGEHQVHFFYVSVGGEVARVEVPKWVALDEKLLDLTHALVLDQCRRGQGYPVALSEAHEQAVVTGADREAFWNFVDDSLEQEGMHTPGSYKSLSKKTRWV